MKPIQIVEQMLQSDAYSRWIGIEVIEIFLGKCILRMKVTSEMLNGFHIAHGGISYALADSALAFAANSYGNQCVSIETSISHTKPSSENDLLTATCTELHRGKTIGIYQVEVKNQDEKLIALFKGTVHISTKIWE
jgi:acyl-CoA thioesterase